MGVTAPKVSKGRSESPLVASAEAKPLPYNRTIKIKIKFPIAEANLLELLKTHLNFSAISFALRRASKSAWKISSSVSAGIAPHASSVPSTMRLIAPNGISSRRNAATAISFAPFKIVHAAPPAFRHSMLSYQSVVLETAGS